MPFNKGSKTKSLSNAYVWIWLPNEVNPVVAGKLTQVGGSLVFNYGQSYLERKNKISLYEPELPLQPGVLPLLGNLRMPGCIRDGSPDAWGRRVIINKKYGVTGPAIDEHQMDELTFLLESGSDRIGALDFQESPTDYRPRLSQQVSLEELLNSAEKVEMGIPLTQTLDQALFHGSPIGGARPKALVDHQDKKFIAKFSSTSDITNVIKSEYIAMRLAKQAGLSVAEVRLEKVMKKDVLLIERFDRVLTSKGWQRKCLVSALTIFGFDEILDARYTSYELLAEKVRHHFYNSAQTLKELYSRLVFNILVGNTDDHARNYAAIWDGKMLQLTPAYDICPQPRPGGEAIQAMLISGANRMSQLRGCFEASSQFLLSRNESISIAEKIADSIVQNWKTVCDEAQVSVVDKKMLGLNQFFNPFAFENLDSDCRQFETLFREFKKLQ